MELRKRKTEDDGKDRAGDVAQKDRKEKRDLPVFAAADDEVEVAAELVALRRMVSLAIF
jgi:hypothetical protein